MDMNFMEDFYDGMRADEICEKAATRNSNYGAAHAAWIKAKGELIDGLGLAYLLDHSHKLSPEEKRIWLLFDAVECKGLFAQMELLKGAYLIGAEDRERMLR